MQIDHLDHIVLTAADIDATIAFYTRVLGMRPVITTVNQDGVPVLSGTAAVRMTA